MYILQKGPTETALTALWVVLTMDDRARGRWIGNMWGRLGKAGYGGSDNLQCNVEGASSCSHASKSLTVLYYNARSILPKVDELQANVLSQKPDLICIVDTALKMSQTLRFCYLTTRCTDWTVIGMAVALLYTVDSGCLAHLVN